MQHPQDEMEEMFGESFSRFHMHNPLDNLSKAPDVDLQDPPDSYVVTVNVPGADEPSMQVKLENQRLLHISVKTERAHEADDKNGQYRYRERFSGEFHRLLSLPGPGDSTKLTTRFRNGVLTITIPKQ